MNSVYLVLFTVLVFLIIDTFIKNQKKRPNSPPSPPFQLPLLGSLHLLGSNPHRGMRNNISDKYGPIVGCYLGDHYSIILSDSKYVNEIYVKKFRKFCSRPHNDTFTMFSGGYCDLAFSDNFDGWRELRSLLDINFTKTKLTDKLYSYIENQTKVLIKSMKRYESNNLPFYPENSYFKLTLNVICKLFFSVEALSNESISDSKIGPLSDSLKKISKKLGCGHLNDFVSITSPLFYLSKKKYCGYVKICTDFISEVYDDHLANLDKDNAKDLMDLLIIDTDGKDKKRVVSIALNFLLGGSDSSSGTAEFFSLYMINYPEYQERAYNEIISVFGKDCSFISYKDKSKLPFLNACINEVLRLNPEDPLGIPRRETEDMEIFGYHIPKGAQIHHNIYAIGTDPQIFKDRDSFKPERWIDCDDETRATLLRNFMPFSVGPRSCIGKNLSEVEIFVMCANLLLNYQLSSYKGKKLDEYEDFGITTHPKEYSIKLISRK